MVKRGARTITRKNKPSPFWISVLTAIKALETRDILTSYNDNLNDFTHTIKTICSNSIKQIFGVDQKRNYFIYVVCKGKRNFLEILSTSIRPQQKRLI